MVDTAVEVVETVGEKQARELAEKTAEILEAARGQLDANEPEALRGETITSRVKGTIDKLSVFISSANIRFTDGVSMFVLDVDSPVVQDGETGIVLVTLKPQV